MLIKRETLLTNNCTSFLCQGLVVYR